MKAVAKTHTKKTAAKPAKKAVPRSALRGSVMTPDQLHESMLTYAKKVSANRKSAIAFLKSIGAPIKTVR